MKRLSVVLFVSALLVVVVVLVTGSGGGDQSTALASDATSANLEVRIQELTNRVSALESAISQFERLPSNFRPVSAPPALNSSERQVIDEMRRMNSLLSEQNRIIERQNGRR